MSSNSLEEISVDNLIQMRDDQSESDSTTSEINENDSTGSSNQSDENELESNLQSKQQSKKPKHTIEFPLLSQLERPLGETLPIPSDYYFESLENYQNTMIRLERENYFRKFRRSFQNTIIKEISPKDNDLNQSTKEEFQLITNYKINETSFGANGLILDLDVSMRIPKYQQEQWEIISNQLMIFVHKTSKKVFLGKSVVQGKEEPKDLFSKFKGDLNDIDPFQEGEYNHKYKEDEEDQEEQNDFEFIDFVQTFQIKMNLFDNLDQFFLSLNDIPSNFYLLSPHQYWNAHEQNINCQYQFKQLKGIAFPDQTLNGEKGDCQFPKYSFLDNSNDQTISIFKSMVQEKVDAVKELDEFQKIALKHALFNENALIQGPPGTGKTFLACRIVTILKEIHCKQTRKPIIVLSKKNLSLDQLLVKILDNNENIKMLRLGYRTTNETIQQYTVSKQQGPEKSQIETFVKCPIKSEEIKPLVKKYLKALKRRDMQMKNYNEVELKLSEDLQYFIKSKLIELLRESVGITDEQQISEDIEEKIFLKWLKGKLTCLRKLTNYLLQTDIFLSSKQESILKEMIEEQQSIKECSLNINEQSVINYVDSITSFEQFTLGFGQFLLKNQDALEIQTIITKMRLFENFQRDIRASKNEIYQDKLATFMEDFDVIGMTFTGYHMHFQALQQLKPEIVVVEEASEIIESEFYPVLTPSLKHLIQIGDHLQLRPIIKSNSLQNEYNYKMSYFERLISVNKVDIITLFQQRRMVPQFANFTRLFYGDKYIDDKSTKKRAFSKEISQNGMYMLQHSYPDIKMSDCSFTNLYEAIFIKSLVAMLVKKYGVIQDKISVLTMYKSQKILIQNKLSGKQGFNQVEVSTIDQFQGNENDFIILSCVRSNMDMKCGFVLNDHRINVAFSRARRGFFSIGNFEMFAKQSSTWEKIINLSNKQFSYGGLIPSPLYKRIHKSIIERLEIEQKKQMYRGIFSSNDCNFCNEESHIGKCSGDSSPRIRLSIADMYQNYINQQISIQREYQQQLLNEQEELQQRNTFSTTLQNPIQQSQSFINFNLFKSNNGFMSLQEYTKVKYEPIKLDKKQLSKGKEIISKYQNEFIKGDNGEINMDEWTEIGRQNQTIFNENQKIAFVYNNFNVQDVKLSQKERKKLLANQNNKNKLNKK